MMFKYCSALIVSVSLCISAFGQGLEVAAERDGWRGGVRYGEGGAFSPAIGELEQRKIDLGGKLFFDPRLSGSGATSCATCHNPRYAWAQPLPTSAFDTGKIGPRNAPSLLDIALRPYYMLDGRFPTLEAQVFGPMVAHGEMGLDIADAARRIRNIDDYEARFIEVFGAPPSPDTLAEALAAFERTIVTGHSRFDRFYLFGERDALSHAEKRGFDLFVGKARCASCHVLEGGPKGAPPLFSDFKFRNLGVGFLGKRFADEGLAKRTKDRKDLGAFRTPSLRNVALSAPYMHDGSLLTLRDVVEFYNAGGEPNPNISPVLRPLGLTEQEKIALIAFLHSLTSEEFERHKVARRLGPDFE